MDQVTVIFEGDPALAVVGSPRDAMGGYSYRYPEIQRRGFLAQLETPPDS